MRLGSTALPSKPTAAERFWAKIDVRGPDECWPWTGATHPVSGAGQFSAGGRNNMVYAHRYAYELLVGPIPQGLVLDHHCENAPCCNPAHLEPVSNGVNIIRGKNPAATNARKTHCIHGHPLSGSNIYKSQVSRICKTCARERERRRRQARASKASP